MKLPLVFSLQILIVYHFWAALTQFFVVLLDISFMNGFILHRVSLDMTSVQGNTGPKWEEKNNTAFWRGRDSCKERLELVKMSRKHPDLIDAAFTHFFFFKHDESLYGPIVQPISFFDFFKVGDYCCLYLTVKLGIIFEKCFYYKIHRFKAYSWVHSIAALQDAYAQGRQPIHLSSCILGRNSQN